MSSIIRSKFSLLMAVVMFLSIISMQTEETYAAGSKVKITKYNYPTTISVGKSYTVKGKIKSGTKIKRVEIGIVKASTNKWTKYKYEKKGVNSKSFNVKKAAKKLKFNKLAAGTYYYRIYAHTSGGAKTVLNKKFTVKAPVKKKVAEVLTLKTADNATSDLPTDSSKVAGLLLGEKVELVGYNCPSKLANGAGYSVKGRINCNTTIKRVEVGIVVTATNKWSEYKYDNTSVNSNSFDIAKAASALKFEKLPGGTFTYRIYVHTDRAVYIALNQSFTSAASSKPKAAVNWAKKIANDNTYSYGKGYGGYFTCCICAKKTKKKSDAQFTCMPFVAAAFAHGTSHPALVNNGRHMMLLNNENFQGNLGNAWFKLGLCKDLKISDLQPGDVIIKWSATNDTGHALLYAGGDVLIEATPAKSVDDQIAIKNGAAERLYRYGHSSGATGKNYVMRFRD